MLPSSLIRHIYTLEVPPVLDVLGKWVHLRNARVGTTSMDEGPLKSRGIHKRRNRHLWQTVWDEVVVPKIDNATIFTFVRNPWDRICSAFFQCRDRAKTPENQIDSRWEFADWVKRVLAIKGTGVNMHFAEQYPTAYFNGERFCFVGFFEHMERDWGHVARLIGLSERLPHWNAAGHGSYVDHYDDESQQIVAELYKRDIAVFRYEFGK